MDDRTDVADFASEAPLTGMTTWRLADGRTVQTSARYYVASCDACGWAGSSGACGVDFGLGDDSDVYCPSCGRPGADSGSLAATAKEVSAT